MKHLLLLTCLLSMVSTAMAQSYSRLQNRDQGWEVTMMLKDQGAETISGPVESEADFSSNTGWGFSVGYNFNSALNLAFEMSHTNPKYRATFLDEDGESRTISHRSDFYTGNFNLTYHFMPQAKIRPFVMAGAGWTTVDSNVSDGKGYCVPDYYWGWYCYNTSYSETNFSYNAAVGLKADLSKTMFLRGSYGMQWIDLGGGSSDSELDVYRLELGFKYY